jgi:uncharacterized protein
MSLTYQQMGTAARGQAHALFSQTMSYVAATAALFALGAWLGRNLSGGVGIVAFIAAFACLIGMRFAARSSAQLTVGLLAAFGLLIGLAVAPTVAYYGSMDPRALWEAGGATALFVAGFGAAGYATRRDLTAIARVSFWALLALIVVGIVLIFVHIPGADLAYSILGLVIFAGFTMFDFQRLRTNTDTNAAPLLAASIFLDLLNVFLFFLEIFSGSQGRELRAGSAPGTRPVRLRQLEDERPGGRWAEGRLGEGLERDPVQVRLPLPLQGDAVPQLLGNHHVVQHGVGIVPEAEYDKGLTEDGVLRVEGENPQGQVRPVGLLGQPPKLFVHHRLVADPALQDRFIEHDRELQPLPIENLLASHADPDHAPDHARRHRLDPAVAADDVPGVSLGLQQAGHHVNVPYGHGRRLVLQADELLIVLGDAIGEFLPPALLGRVLGEPEQQRPAGPGDLVVVEQPLDLRGPQAGPGSFVPADLRRRPPQRGGDRVAALALVFPDLAQFGGKTTPPHRGACWRAHQAFLLLGAAQAGGCRAGGWVRSVTHISPKHAISTLRTHVIANRNHHLRRLVDRGRGFRRAGIRPARCRGSLHRPNGKHGGHRRCTWRSRPARASAGR